MREANARGEKLGFSDEELAFYDALEVNDSAVKVLGETIEERAGQAVIHGHQGQCVLEKRSARLLLPEFVSLAENRQRRIRLSSGYWRRGKPARCQLRASMFKGGNQPAFECLFVLSAFVHAVRNKLRRNKLHPEASQSS